MGLPNIWNDNLIGAARIISKDSKIYQAFKPELYDLSGITLDDFMQDKDLRRTYRQKYTTIKANLQRREERRTPLKDEECMKKIYRSAMEWKEFVETARDNTNDGGKTIIGTNSLETYITMSVQEKRQLERNLITAAIKRVRSMSNDLGSAELEKMLEDTKTVGEKQRTSRR